MTDVLVLGIIGPSRVLIVRTERGANGVQAAHELTILTERLQYAGADPSHNVHVGDDVRRVGNLYADLRNRGTDWAHAVGDHIHRAARHGTGIEPLQLLSHLGGIFPIIRGAGIVLAERADESPVLHARHIAGVGTDQNTVGSLLGIQRDSDSG